eukprot:TRINITY_DN44465_c0_g1_i1.p1 TRINITY_DN44465_c0_g1~~TRINITY_DN44465_c0_g1_i1.p1  ORF type:complete len:724 (+),score=93.38 TRINITY_DN44465_c0_g1_i1:116-2287(+)
MAGWHPKHEQRRSPQPASRVLHQVATTKKRSGAAEARLGSQATHIYGIATALSYGKRFLLPKRASLEDEVTEPADSALSAAVADHFPQTNRQGGRRPTTQVESRLRQSTAEDLEFMEHGKEVLLRARASTEDYCAAVHAAEESSKAVSEGARPARPLSAVLFEDDDASPDRQPKVEPRRSLVLQPGSRLPLTSSAPQGSPIRAVRTGSLELVTAVTRRVLSPLAGADALMEDELAACPSPRPYHPAPEHVFHQLPDTWVPRGGAIQERFGATAHTNNTNGAAAAAAGMGAAGGAWPRLNEPLEVRRRGAQLRSGMQRKKQKPSIPSKWHGQLAEPLVLIPLGADADAGRRGEQRKVLLMPEEFSLTPDEPYVDSPGATHEDIAPSTSQQDGPIGESLYMRSTSPTADDVADEVCRTWPLSVSNNSPSMSGRLLQDDWDDASVHSVASSAPAADLQQHDGLTAEVPHNTGVLEDRVAEVADADAEVVAATLETRRKDVPAAAVSHPQPCKISCDTPSPATKRGRLQMKARGAASRKRGSLQDMMGASRQVGSSRCESPTKWGQLTLDGIFPETAPRSPAAIWKGSLGSVRLNGGLSWQSRRSKKQYGDEQHHPCDVRRRGWHPPEEPEEEDLQEGPEDGAEAGPDTETDAASESMQLEAAEAEQRCLAVVVPVRPPPAWKQRSCSAAAPAWWPLPEARRSAGWTDPADLPSVLVLDEPRCATDT